VSEVLVIHSLDQTLGRLKNELSFLAMKRKLLIANLADDKNGLPRGFSRGKPDLVLTQRFFDHLTDIALQFEKTIRGHHPIDPLMRPEVVVVIHIVREALAGLAQLLRLHPLPELLVHRLPESLALSDRLRMMRARHDVPDSLSDHQLLKVTFSAPAKILRPLVRQHLLGFSKTLDTRQQRFHHELLALMHLQRPAHDVAAAIVQEDREINALAVPREDKARDIALPKLHGSRTLETADPFRALDPLLLRRTRGNARFFERVAHAPSGDLHPSESKQEVPHAFESKLRILGFDRRDLFCDRLWKPLASALFSTREINLVLQALASARFVGFNPVEEASGTRSPGLGEFFLGHPAFQIRFNGLTPLLGRIWPRV